MYDSNRSTHISQLRQLLSSVPGVTEQQALMYLAKQFGTDDTRVFKRSISNAEQNKVIWRQKVGECSFISISKDVAAQITTKDFPYVFWLYLALAAPGESCQYALHPFLAQFARRIKDYSEILAEVALFDCNGTKLPLAFANEVHTASDTQMRQLKLTISEMSKAFWRVLVLKNCSSAFLESRDFQLLQGVGFSCFFEDKGYNYPPSLVYKVDKPKDAWMRYLI